LSVLAKAIASLLASGSQVMPARVAHKVKVRHEGRFVVVGLDVLLAGAYAPLLAALLLSP